MSIEEIRKHWGLNAWWLEEGAKRDIHTLLAAVDSLTAERDKLQTERDNALKGAIDAEGRVGIALFRNSQLTAERDAALARVKELEALISYPGTCRECVHWYRPNSAEGVCYRGYCLTQREGDESCAFGKYKEAKPDAD